MPNEPVKVTLGQVLKLAPRAVAPYIEAFRDHAAETFARYEIDRNCLRISHFMAQILHESGGLRLLRENMNYRAPRIVQVFGPMKHSAGVTLKEAEGLAGRPEALAERVYGVGNPKKAKELGNTVPGYGWLYRGGGPGQVTGHDAYERIGKKLGIDLVGDPDLVIDPKWMLAIFAEEWTEKNLNIIADTDNIVIVTRRVNGGLNGLAERKNYLLKNKAVWCSP